MLKFDSDARLELMQRPDIRPVDNSNGKEYYGYAHLAISVGSEKEVNSLTKKLQKDGFPVLAVPGERVMVITKA